MVSAEDPQIHVRAPAGVDVDVGASNVARALFPEAPSRPDPVTVMLFEGPKDLLSSEGLERLASAMHGQSTARIAIKRAAKLDAETLTVLSDVGARAGVEEIHLSVLALAEELNA